MTKDTTSSNRYWTYAILLALIGGLVFIMPYAGVVVLAALMAFLFYPMFRAINKKIRRPAFAGSLTLLASIIIVLIPIGLVLSMTFTELGQLAAQLSTIYPAESASTPPIVTSTIETINTFLAPLNDQQPVLTDDSVSAFLHQGFVSVVQVLSTALLNIVGSIPNTLIVSLMYLVFFVEFLVYGKQIIATIKTISPFEAPITNRYIRTVGLMASAMSMGQLLISFIISLLSSILMIFLGLGDYFFLMVVGFTLLNLVPLGCGVVVIPICIISILTGNVVPGIIILILYLLVANLDSVIRPMIIPKEVQFSAGLTMLAAFGGLIYFGIMGVVYGPIILIMVTTTISMYADFKRGELATTSA